MTEPGFTIKGVRQGAPFRLRSHFAGYAQFADSRGAVLIAPETSRHLRKAAGLARPNETGGLLSGRVFRDSDGPYVVVAGFVEAPRGAGRPFGFKLSPEAASRLREAAWRARPTADVVGWWHSHPGPSEYSATDLSQQRIWTQPESVGVLVFADGRLWGAVYQGPDARVLLALNGAPPRPAEPVLMAGKRLPWPGGGSQHRDLSGHAAARPWRPTRRQRVVMAALAFAIVAIIVTGLTLLGQVASGQGRLFGQLGGLLAAPAGQIWLTWSCVSQPFRPHFYLCVADLSDPAGAVEWKLDGRIVSHDRVTAIRFPAGNVSPHLVQVLVRDRSRTYDGGSQLIS